jgi:HK97 family phage prohead protease
VTQTLTKSFVAEIKSVDVLTGVVEAIVSVFGTVDHGGDVVVKGAFDESLAEWKASGDPIPFIWSHDWANPEAHIGFITEAKETDEGLWVKAQCDVGRPFADQVLHLLDERRVKQFSFGYEVREKASANVDGQRVRELLKLGLIEAGPTLMGMHPDTRLIGTASRDLGEKAEGMPAEVKAIIGSIEALGDRLNDALEHAYPRCYPYIRGVLADGDSAGVVVYDLWDRDTWERVSWQESYADDGSIVTLSGDASEVQIMEVVQPAPERKDVSGDTPPNISDERKQRVLALLTKTRHEKGPAT